MRDLTEDDSEIFDCLHASLALVHADLSDSPPPMSTGEWWSLCMNPLDQEGFRTMRCIVCVRLCVSVD